MVMVKEKEENKRPISKFMTIFMIVCLALLIFQIIKLNLLPAKLIVLVSLVMIILMFDYFINITL